MDTKLILLFAILIAIVIYFYIDYTEKFSSSGLAMSNVDCNKLVNIYNGLDPHQSYDNGHHMICDKSRRSSIYPYTGNYYAVNGNLV